MSDKKYSGNFYKTDKIEETPDDCPNCLYQNKKAEKDPDECPQLLLHSQQEEEGRAGVTVLSKRQ